MERRRSKARQAFSILMAALLCCAVPASAGAVEEPAGYRMEDYRAPVPQTLKGARVVSTQEAEALWRQKAAIFIDVMPDTPNWKFF